MKYNPEEILEEFEDNKIDLLTATELLTSIIENSKRDEIRINAINKLVKIIPLGNKLFEILENLVVSDESAEIRHIAINYIGNFFLYKALPLLNWAIKNEADYICQIEIVKLLGILNIKDSKLALFQEIQKFIKKKYINKDRKIENKKFRKVLKKYLKERSFEEFTHKELVKILINILIISYLFTQFNNVYYELNPQNGLIIKLDLSDMEYEVKGTPWTWKNNIKSLSEIPSLNHLNSLHHLDLSNNQIDNLKELINLPNLTHLILRNNRLSILKNLDYINNLHHLEFIDLRGNEIVKYIKKNDFNPKIRVPLKDYYTKIK
ncbi:MAG: hypothetical protein ACFE8B_05430 [Candidatus Hermodarchaeota archaeon]